MTESSVKLQLINQPINQPINRQNIQSKSNGNVVLSEGLGAKSSSIFIWKIRNESRTCFLFKVLLYLKIENRKRIKNRLPI